MQKKVRQMAQVNYQKLLVAPKKVAELRITVLGAVAVASFEVLVVFVFKELNGSMAYYLMILNWNKLITSLI